MVTGLTTVAVLLVALFAPALHIAPADARTEPLPVGTGGTDLGPMRVRPLGSLKPGVTRYGLWSSTRDCGISTRLSTGRILWVWCDSTLFDESSTQTGNVVPNSAALAAVDSPLVNEDVLVDGKLTALIPAQTHFPCSGFRAAWPHGVVTLPDTDGKIATDRVAIWFENICHYPGDDGTWTYEEHGVGVAMLNVDLRWGPQPWRARVLRHDLFPSQPSLEHQFGAVLGPPPTWNRVHLYACESEGSCSVRRVLVSNDAVADEARLVDPAAYEKWDGAAWAGAGGTTAPVLSGSGPTKLSRTGISVAWVPRLQRYVAAYLPWPGIGHQAVLTTARLPQGPWSAPVLVPLPSCGSIATCYSLNVHAHFGAPDGIGLSYLRALDFYGTKQGSSRWFARAHLATVPFGAARPACATAEGVRFDAEVQLGVAAYRWRRLDDTWWPWLEVPGGPWVGRPAMATMPDGVLRLYLVHKNGTLWHLVRTDGSGFSAPQQLTPDAVFGGGLSAVAKSNGIEVFDLGADGVVRKVWLPVGSGASVSVVGGLPSGVTAIDATNGAGDDIVLALLTTDGAIRVRRRTLTGWTDLPATSQRAWPHGGVAVHSDDAGDPTVTVIEVTRRPIVVDWPGGGDPTVRAPGSYLTAGNSIVGCEDPDGAAVVVATAPDLVSGRQATALDADDPSTMGPVGAR